MIRLVDDLLDVARITSGKIALHKEPVELTGLLSQVAETARAFVTDRAQTLSVSLPADAIWHSKRMRRASRKSSLICCTTV